jgi:hypothetical protein
MTSTPPPSLPKVTLCAGGECPPEVEQTEDGMIAVNGKLHTAAEFGEFVTAIKNGRYDELLT